MDLDPKRTFSRMEKPGKGWLLEDHAHFFSKLNQIGSRFIDIFIADQDLTFNSNIVN